MLFVKPYTKEFDDVMFGNFDSKDYVIEETSLQVSSIMDGANKMYSKWIEDGKILMMKTYQSLSRL